ncbi:MAG: hypothetical protein ACI4JW_06410 [Oscillospiraceae bacterium]
MKKRSMNQKGSVLLAVVCMTMVCMTLATIALSVVNYTMKASNRNVQRTQAKVTAEAALTEFIDYYRTQAGGFDDLLNYASGTSRSTGTEIDVNMVGNTEFESNYGDCKMYVYRYGTGFKVDSVCSFATQEQTASVFFNVEVETPYIPSNTVETSNKASITGGVATPVDGNVYLERDDTDPTNPRHLALSNSALYKGHFFSEYNIDIFNSGTYIEDGLNKTGTTNFYHPDANFMQAPTLTVDGYVVATNSGSGIRTTVGKSTVDGKNSDDYASEDEYRAAELANTDGYIYTFKKLIMCGNAFQVGTNTRPIDVYCRGAYFGPVPSKLKGVTTDREEILEAFDGSLPEYDSRVYQINGNFYSYKGQAELLQSGDLVLNRSDLVINGDLFVKGDIYLLNNSYIEANTVYCEGTIYTCDYNGDVISQCQIVAQPGGGYALSGTANITGNVSNMIDTTNVVRNRIPEVGYDPATGISSSTRKGMSVYDGCSSNDMFDISINGTLEEQAATKNIAEKYAMAMTRDLDSDYVALSGATEPVKTQLTSNIDVIHASVKLGTSDIANNRKYMVQITDEDIVIALPMASIITYPWGGTGLSSTINSIFRIDRSQNVTGNNYFCYFVFYDPDEPAKCFYLDNDYSGVTRDGVYYTFTGTTNEERANHTICFTKNNGTGDLLVADFAAVYTGSGSDYTMDYQAVNNGCTMPNITAYKNYIMYLVPDYTEFQLGATGQPSFIQGIVYALKSDVTIGGPNQNKIFGQVKCATFNPPADHKIGVVQDMPIADESLLGYVGYKNSSNTSVEIQYYEY